jgi:hypothetical protein
MEVCRIIEVGAQVVIALGTVALCFVTWRTKQEVAQLMIRVGSIQQQLTNTIVIGGPSGGTGGQQGGGGGGGGGGFGAPGGHGGGVTFGDDQTMPP